MSAIITKLLTYLTYKVFSDLASCYLLFCDNSVRFRSNVVSFIINVNAIKAIYPIKSSARGLIHSPNIHLSVKLT